MKIKQHISIILSILLLYSSSGLALNVHYCNDKVAFITLKYQETTSISCIEISNTNEVAEQTTSCCSNKLLKTNKDTSKKIIKEFQLQLVDFVLTNNWFTNLVINEIPSLFSTHFIYNSRANAPPLYKLYCRYIFYS